MNMHTTPSSSRGPDLRILHLTALLRPDEEGHAPGCCLAEGLRGTLGIGAALISLQGVEAMAQRHNDKCKNKQRMKPRHATNAGNLKCAAFVLLFVRLVVCFPLKISIEG